MKIVKVTTYGVKPRFYETNGFTHEAKGDDHDLVSVFLRQNSLHEITSVSKGAEKAEFTDHIPNVIVSNNPHTAPGWNVLIVSYPSAKVASFMQNAFGASGEFLKGNDRKWSVPFLPTESWKSLFIWAESK